VFALLGPNGTHLNRHRLLGLLRPPIRSNERICLDSTETCDDDLLADEDHANSVPGFLDPDLRHRWSPRICSSNTKWNMRFRPATVRLFENKARRAHRSMVMKV
jgi:hypothetical protein